MSRVESSQNCMMLLQYSTLNACMYVYVCMYVCMYVVPFCRFQQQKRKQTNKTKTFFILQQIIRSNIVVDNTCTCTTVKQIIYSFIILFLSTRYDTTRHNTLVYLLFFQFTFRILVFHQISLYQIQYCSTDYLPRIINAAYIESNVLRHCETEIAQPSSKTYELNTIPISTTQQSSSSSSSYS